MHTEGGLEMLKHFLMDISGVKPDWTMDQVLEEQLRKISDLVRGRGGGAVTSPWNCLCRLAP